jgi:hypothetical protein
MKKQDFENLVDSVRQAGRIRRGEAKPSRVTAFAPVDVEGTRRVPFRGRWSVRITNHRRSIRHRA